MITLFNSRCGDMSRLLILLAVVWRCQLLLAAVDYHAFCINATEALAKNQTTVPAFTNSVEAFIAASQGTECASANVVKSIALYDAYEQTVDAAALDFCTAICTNIIQSADCPEAAWQKAAARLVMAVALATQCQYEHAFAVCTNALSRPTTSPVTTDEANLWTEICRHQFLSGLSVPNALGFYAALSLRFADPTADLSAYTNALPPVVLKKLQELTD